MLCQMLGVRQGEEINRRMGRAMPELNLEGKEEFTKQIKEEWATRKSLFSVFTKSSPLFLYIHQMEISQDFF